MILNVEEAASAVDDLHAAIVNRVGMRYYYYLSYHQGKGV